MPATWPSLVYCQTRHPLPSHSPAGSSGRCHAPVRDPQRRAVASERAGVAGAAHPAVRARVHERRDAGEPSDLGHPSAGPQRDALLVEPLARLEVEHRQQVAGPRVGAGSRTSAPPRPRRPSSGRAGRSGRRPTSSPFDRAPARFATNVGSTKSCPSVAFRNANRLPVRPPAASRSSPCQWLTSMPGSVGPTSSALAPRCRPGRPPRPTSRRIPRPPGRAGRRATRRRPRRRRRGEHGDGGDRRDDRAAAGGGEVIGMSGEGPVEGTCLLLRLRSRRLNRSALLGQERFEPLLLIAHRPTRSGGEVAERLDVYPGASLRQVPATCPSIRKVGTEWGVLVLKILGRSGSGTICVRRACTSSVASHVGRNRTGAGWPGSGSGSPRKVEQLAALLVEEAPQRQPLEHRGEHRVGQPGERGDVVARSRAERGEVPAHQQLAPVGLGRARRQRDRRAARRGRRGPLAAGARCPTAPPERGRSRARRRSTRGRRARGSTRSPRVASGRRRAASGPAAPSRPSSRRHARAGWRRATTRVWARERRVAIAQKSRRDTMWIVDPHQGGLHDRSRVRATVVNTDRSRSTSRDHAPT